DFLLLTHAHLDHCGLIPKLVGEGFNHPILTTAPSIELTRIVLQDSAKIQEEDAAYKIKRHQREGRPGAPGEKPLYTLDDAHKSFTLFKEAPFDRPVKLNDRVIVRYHFAGHILGSAFLEITAREIGADHPTTIVFS